MFRSFAIITQMCTKAVISNTSCLTLRFNHKIWCCPALVKQLQAFLIKFYLYIEGAKEAVIHPLPTQLLQVSTAVPSHAAQFETSPGTCLLPRADEGCNVCSSAITSDISFFVIDYHSLGSIHPREIFFIVRRTDKNRCIRSSQVFYHVTYISWSVLSSSSPCVLSTPPLCPGCPEVISFNLWDISPEMTLSDSLWLRPVQRTPVLLLICSS